MKKAIPYIYFGTVIILVGMIFWTSLPTMNLDFGFFRKDNSAGNEVDIKLTQNVFEYGEGFQTIPIYKYVENEDEFDYLDAEPIVIGNRDIGKHDIKFTVKAKGKKQEYVVIKQVEIKDTQPAKIYTNTNFDINNPKSAISTVTDPVDGLLKYKEKLNVDDRGVYSVYKEGNSIVCRAIDLNGNISEKRIDIKTNTKTDEVIIKEEPEQTENQTEEETCVLEKGYDEMYYNFQDEAIAVAQRAFDEYEAEDGKYPRSFNVKVVSCDGYVYYIWDFVW